jgi:hypothetical protein
MDEFRNGGCSETDVGRATVRGMGDTYVETAPASHQPAPLSAMKRLIEQGRHRMTQEALASLKALGKQLRFKLLESPEFRALEVVERTIAELSEILDSPPPPPGRKMPSGTADEAPSEPSAAVFDIQQHAQASAASPTNAQSRMAQAIAATIAANTAARVASGTTPRFKHALSAAS